jgi:hypothetical protein
MEYNQTTASVYNEPSVPQKLPSFLNVITILTIIGSIWAILSAIGTPIINNKLKPQNDKNMEQLEKMNTNDTTKSKTENAFLSIAKSSIEITKKVNENQTGITIVSIIGGLLCLGGAILMRKQKKTGFYLYLVGEWAAIIFMTYLIGGLSGGSLFIAMSLFFPLIFTILYIVNLKHLTK